MLIKQENTQEVKKSDSCKIREYDFSTSNIGFAITKIDGRYPEVGKAINIKSDLIYYIISGKGFIFTQNVNYEVKKGDALLLKNNKWYYIKGENLEIALSSSPCWTHEQYKIID